MKKIVNLKERIILSVTVILALGNNNSIESARKAKFLQSFSNLNDEYSLFCSSTTLKDHDFLL